MSFLVASKSLTKFSINFSSENSIALFLAFCTILFLSYYLHKETFLLQTNSLSETLHIILLRNRQISATFLLVYGLLDDVDFGPCGIMGDEDDACGEHFDTGDAEMLGLHCVHPVAGAVEDFYYLGEGLAYVEGDVLLK